MKIVRLGIVKNTWLNNNRSNQKDYGGMSMDDLAIDKYEKIY